MLIIVQTFTKSSVKWVFKILIQEMRIWRKATFLGIFVTQIWLSNLHGKVFLRNQITLELKLIKPLKLGPIKIYASGIGILAWYY